MTSLLCDIIALCSLEEASSHFMGTPFFGPYSAVLEKQEINVVAVNTWSSVVWCGVEWRVC